MTQIYLSKTKICSQCGSPKSLDEFYRDATCPDGRSARCKVCKNAWRDGHAEEIKEYDRQRAKLPHRVAARKNRDVVIATNYANRHPERETAKRLVKSAMRNGHLVKQPCTVCGSLKVEAHHDDYSKPLEVTWTCRQHHKELDRTRREQEATNIL